MATVFRKFIGRVTPDAFKFAYRAWVMTGGRPGGQDGEEERLEAMVGPPGMWKETRRFQIDFLRRNGLRPSHSLLDIGCGPLRGGIPLIRYLDSSGYTGFDIRPGVVEEAWQQVNIEQLQFKSPNIVVSESFGRDELGNERFDYIWCFQVLYHLTDDLVEHLFAQLAARLAIDGCCYANVNTVWNDGKWLDFPYVRRSLEFYETVASQFGLCTTSLGQLRNWGYSEKVPGQFDHILAIRPISDTF